MGDAIIAHSYRRGVPADGDAGGGGVQHLQVGGSIRDWKIKNREDYDDDRGNEEPTSGGNGGSVLVFCIPLRGRLS